MIEALNFICTLIIGFMIFFMIVVTPSVFKTLDEMNSRKFLRFIFPRMFFYGLILSCIALLLSILISDMLISSIMLIITLLFLINIYVITPRINLYRDQFTEGLTKSEKEFKRYHLISVAIFLSQLLCSIGVVLINYF